MSTGRRRVFVAALATTLLVGAGASAGKPQPPSARPTVLILHDTGGDWGELGEVYSIMLRNLLGHFPVDVVVKPVGEYSSVRTTQSLATFYLGTTYDEPALYAPGTAQRASWDAFASDVATGARPTVWMGFNLWHLAWIWNPAWGTSFASRFGFDFQYLDEAGQYNRVVYKGVELDKGVVRHRQPGADVAGCPVEPATGFYNCAPGIGVVTVTDPAKAAVVATARSTVTSSSNPYVVDGDRLWYVADIPFAYVSEEDRYLAMADLLHDMIGIDHAVTHRGLVRLEDVGASVPTAGLEATEVVLDQRAVPFTIAAIPIHKDPYGAYSNGVPVETPLGNSATGRVVKRLYAEGASVVQHGTTHQLDSTLNPYNGATGDDFEFYRVTENADFSLAFQGPVPNDSARWAKDRMDRGRRELNQMKITAFGWEAPHYTASATDYKAIQSMYGVQYARTAYFTSSGRMVGQYFPYVVTDSYGYRVVPENLGNISPEEWNGYAISMPADLIRRAAKAWVVRDGFASFYFHPYLDAAMLQQTLDGIIALGYQFVKPCNALATC